MIDQSRIAFLRSILENEAIWKHPSLKLKALLQLQEDVKGQQLFRDAVNTLAEAQARLSYIDRENTHQLRMEIGDIRTALLQRNISLEKAMERISKIAASEHELFEAAFKGLDAQVVEVINVRLSEHNLPLIPEHVAAEPEPSEEEKELTELRAKSQQIQVELEEAKAESKHTRDELEEVKAESQHTRDELSKIKTKSQHTHEELVELKARNQDAQDKLEKARAVIEMHESPERQAEALLNGVVAALPPEYTANILQKWISEGNMPENAVDAIELYITNNEDAEQNAQSELAALQHIGSILKDETKDSAVDAIALHAVSLEDAKQRADRELAAAERINSKLKSKDDELEVIDRKDAEKHAKRELAAAERIESIIKNGERDMEPEEEEVEEVEEEEEGEEEEPPQPIISTPSSEKPPDIIQTESVAEPRVQAPTGIRLSQVLPKVQPTPSLELERPLAVFMEFDEEPDFDSVEHDADDYRTRAQKLLHWLNRHPWVPKTAAAAALLVCILGIWIMVAIHLDAQIEREKREISSHMSPEEPTLIVSEPADDALASEEELDAPEDPPIELTDLQRSGLAAINEVKDEVVQDEKQPEVPPEKIEPPSSPEAIEVAEEPIEEVVEEVVEELEIVQEPLPEPKKPLMCTHENTSVSEKFVVMWIDYDLFALHNTTKDAKSGACIFLNGKNKGRKIDSSCVQGKTTNFPCPPMEKI